MREPSPVDESTFDSFTAPEAGPALIEFTTPWCAPCMALAPVMRELIFHLSGKVRVGRVNADNSPSLASTYSVEAFPTLMLFDRGAPIAHVTGFHAATSLLRWVNHALRSTDESD